MAIESSGGRGGIGLAVLKAKGTAIARYCGAYFIVDSSSHRFVMSNNNKGAVLRRLGTTKLG